MSVPGTSIGSRAELTSRRNSAAAPTAATNAKPRLTNSVQRHDRSWVSTPPSSSPTAAPAPPIAPRIPNAVPRSRGSVNAVLTNESAAGAISAANTPCSPRAATSIPKLCAAPPRADAAPNPIVLATNSRLRPNRSPSRPPASSRLPNASAYAVTTHSRLLLEKCSALCAEGSAMLTTVMSSTIISCAIPRTAKIHHRRAPTASPPSRPSVAPAPRDAVAWFGIRNSFCLSSMREVLPGCALAM